MADPHRPYPCEVANSVGIFRELSYLSKLRRDSVGADFQSVRKLTNYVCAKPPESRLSYLRSSDQEIDCADIGISAPSAKLI